MSSAMSKNWCFTLNNYTDEDEELLAQAPVQYMIYGHEVAPTTLTPHLQGFLVLEKNARVSALKKLHPRCHWEQCKGSAESNQAYCKKEGHNIVERGTPPKTAKDKGEEEKLRWDGARCAAKEGRFDDIPSDIYMRCMSTCHKLATMHQAPPPGLEGELINEWIYGPAGTGKSTRAQAENPGAYLKGLHKWWDGYDGHATVIVDDMDPYHKSLAQDFKQWAHHHPFPAETKGAQMCIRPKKLVVTSNYSIDEIWDDVTTREAMHRRFKEIYITYGGASSPPPPTTPPPSPSTYATLQCNPKKRKSS
nr:replication-associated protein [Tick-associated circular DNA satellite]